MGSNQGETRDSVDEHVDRALREFPEIDPMVEAIVSGIDFLARYLRKSWAEALAEHDLSEGEYKVLVKLGRRASRIASPPVTSASTSWCRPAP